MADKTRTSHERWAHLRFSVVGTLLAAPPGPGELKEELQRLAANVAAPGDGRADALRLRHHRALPLPRADGARATEKCALNFRTICS